MSTAVGEIFDIHDAVSFLYVYTVVARQEKPQVVSFRFCISLGTCYPETQSCPSRSSYVRLNRQHGFFLLFSLEAASPQNYPEGFFFLLFFFFEFPSKISCYNLLTLPLFFFCQRDLAEREKPFLSDCVRIGWRLGSASRAGGRAQEEPSGGGCV